MASRKKLLFSEHLFHVKMLFTLNSLSHPILQKHHKVIILYFAYCRGYQGSGELKNYPELCMDQGTELEHESRLIPKLMAFSLPL